MPNAERDAFMAAYTAALTAAATSGEDLPEYPWLPGASGYEIEGCVRRMTAALVRDSRRGIKRDWFRDSRYLRAAARAVGAKTSPELRNLATTWPEVV